MNLFLTKVNSYFKENNVLFCDFRLSLPEVGWNRNSILLLVANGHHNCIKCTKADVRLRTSDDGQKACPKHVES
jgi:hypothetical protein